MSDIKFSTDNGDKGMKPFKTGFLVPGVVAVIVIILALNCFTIVNEGFVGVKFQFGKIVGENLKPGLNMKIPFIEKIDQVDTRNQIYEFAGDAYTKDTQKVNELQLKVTYRYSQDQLSNLVRNVGIDNIKDRFLVPNVQKIAKDVIGRVNAESLVQSRGDVQNEIQEKLAETLAPDGIVVTAFAIENIAFEAEFQTSIQNKVVAEQKALEAVNVTKQREEEKKQAIIAAEGRAQSVIVEAEAEAEAIALIQAQITQNARYIEYLKIINWDGILPQVIGDGVNPFVVLDGSGSFSNYGGDEE